MRTERDYDVAVIGGGPSGSMAAIAAARAGARTLLIEKHAFLGGSLTAMGVGPMMSFHNRQGDTVVGGIPEELVQRLMATGASPGHIADSTTYCFSVTPFDSEALKITLETMLTETGGELLFHSHFAGLGGAGDGTPIVRICNKGGLSEFSCRVVIDASGDGDVCAAAGVRMEKGRRTDGALQPMTMNLKLANVDTARIRAYVREDPQNFEFEHGAEEGLRRLERTSQLSLKGYFREWEAARARGEVNIPREGVLFFETPTPGVVIVNTTRVQGLDGTDPRQLSLAEMQGRRQCSELYAFLRRHARGFEHAVRMDSAAQIGVRETRRAVGLHTLSGADILEGRQFPDPIALGGYPIDIHSPDQAKTNTQALGATTYQIPLRCLLVERPDYLIVAGRCVSATHEAMAAFRVTPIVMAIGQAAGTLAALAAQRGTAPSQVPYDVLKKVLVANGALLP